MLLVVLEKKGVKMPFHAATLLKMINSDRWTHVARQNYQAGMRTLEKNGLITQTRADNLHLHIQLTDEGRVHGEIELRDRTQGDENEQA